MIRRSQLFTWLLDQMESSESEEERRLILTLGHYINELEDMLEASCKSGAFLVITREEVLGVANAIAKNKKRMPT